MDLANKILEFPNTNVHDSKNTSRSFFKNDIMDSGNDGSGGDGMNYVTREELIANIETVKVSLNSLQKEIELTNKNTVNEIKSYVHEEVSRNQKEISENRKWIIGAVIIPTVATLIPFLKNIPIGK